MRQFLSNLVDRAQAAFPVNRVVVILTPLVFVPASAWLAGWMAVHCPGLPAFTSSQILGTMVLGAVAAFGAAYRWIDGWQSHEAHQHQLTVLAAEHRHGIEAAVAAAAEPHLAGEMLEQLRPSLKG